MDNESVRRTLLAFAASSAISETSLDKFSVVVPIFRAMGAAHSGNVFEPLFARTELSNKFGLDVSEDLINYWIHSLVRHNIIEPKIEYSNNEATYVWTEQEFNHNQILDRTSEIEIEFQKFKESFPDLFLLDDQFDIIELVHDGLITEVFDFPKNQKTDERSYIFSRFVEYLNSGKQSLFEYLSVIRFQAIVVELILNLVDPEGKKPSLSMCNIYLDSPVVMDAVGLNGSERHRHAEFMISSLTELGAKILIADLHLDEIYRNIDGVLSRNVHDRFGPTADAMRRGEINEEMVKIIRDNLKAAIDNCGVYLDNSFNNHLNRSPLNSELRQNLFSIIQSNYNHVEACDRDINVIAGVLSRRGNAAPSSLSQAKSLFITQNDRLAFDANRFLRDHGFQKIKNTPLVLSRTRLSALIASYFGIQKSKEISRLDLISAARSAVGYDPAVYEAIKTKIKSIGLENGDQFINLLKSPDYASLIMDITQGAPKNATGVVTAQLIERAKDFLESKAQKRVEDRFRSANRRMRNRAEKSEEERQAALDRLENETRRINELSVSRKRQFKSQVRLRYRLAVKELREYNKKADRYTREYNFLLGSFILALLAVSYFNTHHLGNEIFIISLLAFAGVVVFVFLNYWPFPFRASYLKYRRKKSEIGLASRLKELGVPSETRNGLSLFRAYLLEIGNYK